MHSFGSVRTTIGVRTDDSAALGWHPQGMAESTIPTICVDRDLDGRWGVWLPSGGHLACESLDDARRVASGRAAGETPYALVVRDAYHRVIARERIVPGPPAARRETAHGRR